jgi:cephalosporin hydroxylase
MAKFPEDLRVYEHLLWLSAPEIVIEVGTQYGGSALWFRDRLRALAAYGRIVGGRVISIDLDTTAAHEHLAAADPQWHEEITLIEGDVRDPELAARVADLVAPGTPCLLSEDSAHESDTTLRALRGLAGFVPVHGFVVVEDGYIDVEELRPPDSDLPRGVLPAIERWLADEDGARFSRRRDLELYGLTSHPFGFLQRRDAVPGSQRRPAPGRQAAPSERDGAPAALSRLSRIVHDLRLQLAGWEDRALTAEQQRERWQERAVTAERQREQWEERTRLAEMNAATAKAELGRVHSSVSWRITSGLRWLKRAALRSAGRQP